MVAGAGPEMRPYGAASEGLVKGGKRSGVEPRSGNRSMTFGL